MYGVRSTVPPYIYPSLTIPNRIPGRPHGSWPVVVTECRKCAVASPKLARFPPPRPSAGEDLTAWFDRSDEQVWSGASFAPSLAPSPFQNPREARFCCKLSWAAGDRHCGFLAGRNAA
ncbi:uncharacterized protein N7473_000289 [Penicillium subrubescens]|uniref:uncharacterized protein n=1 Tax=Penicillium subrubescens TaxID=1316194 RepID=UPI002545B19E|nr:uncharacterized protein N7473_000289 [Penicillium subrubescens]KAJ5910986.1 hypothetical protein N7473_000289 [Penicillium subrubescens]